MSPPVARSPRVAWDTPLWSPAIHGTVARALAPSGVGRWPRGERCAVAVQLVAAAQFLVDRGLYPARRVLATAAVTRTPDGPWVRITAPVRTAIESAALQRRLRRWGKGSDALLEHALRPLLAVVVPELGPELEAARRARPGWQIGQAWLGALLADGRGRPALAHPLGRGRALWARGFALPTSGVYSVEDERLAATLAASWAAAVGGETPFDWGAWEEEELARRSAHDAAAGTMRLLLTTQSIPGIPPLPLAAESESAWVFAAADGAALTYAGVACEAGANQPEVAAAILAAGAASAFVAPPSAPLSADERERLASPAARSALAWLRAAGIGLSEEEMAAVDAEAARAFPELLRLGLATHGRNVWVGVAAGHVDPRRVQRLADGLPDGAARALAVFRARGGAGALSAWCEASLAAGQEARTVLAAAQVAASPPDVALAAARIAVADADIALAGAEAALDLGRLNDAEVLLDGVAPDARGPRWQVLAAWWAERAGAPARDTGHVPAIDAPGLPCRLQVRLALSLAMRAFRRSDVGLQRACLQRAVELSCGTPLASLAELEMAMFEGRGALRSLARRRWSTWGADERARWFHLVAIDALNRGAAHAAGTALRAALRNVSGEDRVLVADLHADLGSASMLAEKPVFADLQLSRAEALYERCGSLRSVIVVRANRAVVACDRLDWRAARFLIEAARSLRESSDDLPFWLEEFELVRSDLARGDRAAVRRALPALAAAVGRFGAMPEMVHGIAALRAHLALAEGDLEAARGLLPDLDPSEHELVRAVLAAADGGEPRRDLSPRWGMAFTARWLAALGRGAADAVRGEVAAALDGAPREAAVGLARAAAILARRSERLPEPWSDLVDRAVEILESAELAEWAAAFAAGGIDARRLVRALDDVLSAGTDALAPGRVAVLARVLRLTHLALRRDGRELVSWGEADEPFSWSAGEVEISAQPAPAATARAALELIARRVDAMPGDERADVAPMAGLIGESAAMQRVRTLIGRWAPLPMTVLVVGEPGTGKELVARELHRASGRRGSFVAVNCAGIPAALLEAELFGVVRGAFTGADRDRIGLVEEAEGGTLFLDEVGELPLDLQGKLLRLLQDREVRRVGATRMRNVDVRFVAATNRRLETAAEAGQFRRDLYYRLAVAVLPVPPLRDRPEDIPALAKHFVRLCAAEFRRPGVHLAPAAVEVLRAARWPGNVRELGSAIQRAVADASPHEAIGPDRFPGLAGAAQPAPADSWANAYDQFRRTYFERLLGECGGNRSLAARRAGISRQTLLYHLRELGLGSRPGGSPLPDA